MAIRFAKTLAMAGLILLASCAAIRTSKPISSPQNPALLMEDPSVSPVVPGPSNPVVSTRPSNSLFPVPQDPIDSDFLSAYLMENPLAFLDSELMPPDGLADEALSDEPGTETEEEPEYDVPIVINESVEDYIDYFNTVLRDKFKLWLERSGRYIPLMREIFKGQGLPADLVFVALIESGFNPYAYSRARAVGPWQFIQSTGKIYGLKINGWVDERRDPIKSTRAAARYLKDLYKRFGSWPLAMAAYNAGEGKIERALAKANTGDFWDLRPTRYIRNETKGYVPKYMAATIIAKNPERYGFTLDYHDPFEFDTVTVPGSANLRVIAKTADIPFEDLKALNPELRAELTPPYANQYSLRLPSGAGAAFDESYAKIPEDKKLIGTQYVVRKSDTLSGIANRFGTSVEMMRDLNRLPKNAMLRIGQVLYVPAGKLQAGKEGARNTAVASGPTPESKDGSARSSIQMASASKAEQADRGDPGRKILYLVKHGDTLWDISRNFNVSLQELRKHNGLGKRSLIRPGDQLVLGYEAGEL